MNMQLEGTVKLEKDGYKLARYNDSFEGRNRGYGYLEKPCGSVVRIIGVKEGNTIDWGTHQGVELIEEVI